MERKKEVERLLNHKIESLKNIRDAYMRMDIGEEMNEAIETENEKPSLFDTAMNHLDKIANQLERGMINKNDYDGQRLIILIDLVINQSKIHKDKDR
jgi:hypothetical protein